MRVAPGSGPGPAGAAVGVYRGRIHDETGRSRRFRLLLFAELPDRLHAEVVSPLGRNELILDAGPAGMAIAVVRDKVAFVGPADPAVLERVIGVELGPAELVQVLLTGEPVPTGDYELRRTPAGSNGLPQMLEIRSDGRGVVLELRRLQPLRKRMPGLATGSPPDGFERRGLDEFHWDWFEEPDPQEPRP